MCVDPSCYLNVQEPHQKFGVTQLETKCGKQGFFSDFMKVISPSWSFNDCEPLQHRLLCSLHSKIKGTMAPFKVEEGESCSKKTQHSQCYSKGGFQPHNLCFAGISMKVKDHSDETSSSKGGEATKKNLEQDMQTAKEVGQDMRVPVPQANVPGIGEVASLALKQLLCGTSAGAVSSFVAAPFENLRTRVIAGQGGSSTGEVVENVSQREGIRNLIGGSLTAAMMITGLHRGVQFVIYEAMRRSELQKLGKDPQWIPGVTPDIQVVTVAGALAGFGSTLAVYPFTSLSERMVVKPREYSSLSTAATKVIKEGGVRELFRGSIPAIMTFVPQSIASFYTYESLYSYLHRTFTEWRNTFGMVAFSSITAGAAAGLVSGGLTYPLEVARKKINITALQKGTPGSGSIKYNNLLQALFGIIEHEGFSALYRGYVLQALEFIPMTAVSFMVYEVAKRAFVAQNEESRDEVKG